MWLEAPGADHSLGADQLFLLLLTVWLGVSVTHTNGSDKTICWHVRAAEISFDLPVSRFSCVCACIMSSLNVLAEQNQSSIHLDYIRGGTNLRQWHFRTWMYDAESVEWIGPWNVMMSYFQDQFPLHCMIACAFMQWKFEARGISPCRKAEPFCILQMVGINRNNCGLMAPWSTIWQINGSKEKQLYCFDNWS